MSAHRSAIGTAFLLSVVAGLVPCGVRADDAGDAYARAIIDARKASKEGDFLEAYGAAKHALAAKPDGYEAHYLAAYAAWKLQQPERAKAEALLAYQTAPAGSKREAEILLNAVGTPTPADAVTTKNSEKQFLDVSTRMGEVDTILARRAIEMYSKGVHQSAGWFSIDAMMNQASPETIEAYRRWRAAVVKIPTTRYATAPPSDGHNTRAQPTNAPPSPTLEAYEKIRVGMSENETTAILGKETKAYDDRWGVRKFFGDPERDRLAIWVIFRDGDTVTYKMLCSFDVMRAAGALSRQDDFGQDFKTRPTPRLFPGALSRQDHFGQVDQRLLAAAVNGEWNGTQWAELDKLMSKASGEARAAYTTWRAANIAFPTRGAGTLVPADLTFRLSKDVARRIPANELEFIEGAANFMEQQRRVSDHNSVDRKSLLAKTAALKEVARKYAAEKIFPSRQMEKWLFKVEGNDDGSVTLKLFLPGDHSGYVEVSFSSCQMSDRSQLANIRQEQWVEVSAKLSPAKPADDFEFRFDGREFGVSRHGGIIITKMTPAGPH